MRTLITASVLTFLALSGTAMAAPAVPTDASASAMSVQVVAGSQRKLSLSEFKGLQGEYQMQDGSTLVVSGENRTLFAALDGHARTELIPLNSNVFAARGEDMVLTFERQSYSVNDVSINMPKK